MTQAVLGLDDCISWSEASHGLTIGTLRDVNFQNQAVPEQGFQDGMLLLIPDAKVTKKALHTPRFTTRPL